ncbi:hypothetical protein [Streptomyces sp. DH12]|uniref:hypothetical protein n=1 Tax=Streptomyces sp. DH12 TaxID=2857010 RepID=UPI00226C4EFA|nr:hypothetical protein [Streptomyces sp. DH12]
MNERQYGAASVRRLAAVVERIAPRDRERWEQRERVPGAGGVPVQVSRSRADQLWMVVGMFDRAVGREEMPVRAGRSAAQLFTWAALRPFWALAAAGTLRAREQEVARPLSVASLRIVRDCLDMLARVVVPGKVVRLPVVEQVEPKAVVAPRSRAVLYRELVDLAGADRGDWRAGLGLSWEERARLLAMVAVVLDTGARSGELAALRMPDLAAGEEAVGVRRRVQRGSSRVEEISALAEVHPDTVRAVLGGRLERMSYAKRQRVLAAVGRLEPAPEVEWYPLRDGTRVAVRRWLAVREQIVQQLPLEGGRPGVWVTLSATQVGPPGVTLGPRGLRDSYGRGMAALNTAMAGRFGWEPLPTTLEQLRRAVDVEPLEKAPV